MAMLKQSTARSRVILMVDSSDHVTGKTGLTLTITASKDGGSFASITPTVTELATGFYKLALTTSHTDTLGDLALHITSSGADPTDVVDEVVLDLPGVAQTGDNYARLGAPAGASHAADVAAVKTDTGAIKTKTDSLTFTVAGVVDANSLRVGGTAQTGRDIGASVLLSAGSGTGQLDFTSGVVKANATQWLGGTIPAVNVTGVPLIDLKYTLGTISPATAGSVRADAVTGAVGSVTGAVASVTGNVGGNVTGSVGSVSGNVGGNVVGSVASVTARVTANTDQLAGQTVTAAAGVTFPTSVASPTNITAGTITTATNLTNAPTAGDFTATMKTSLNAATPAVTVSDKTGFSLSSGGVQGVWDALTSALTTSGSIGKWIVDKLDVVLSTRLATSGYTAPLDAAGTRSAVGLGSANLDTQLGAIKTVTDKVDDTLELAGSPAAYRFTSAALAEAPSGGSDPATIAAAVWDEDLAGHAISGSAGDTLSAAGSAGDPWSTALPGAYGSGTAGKIIGDNINATISSRLASGSYTAPLDAAATRSAVGLASANLDTQLDALPTAAENATAVWGAGTRVLTAGTNIALAKGTGVTGFNDLSAAQVNAEADTALSDVGLTTTITGRIDAAISTRLPTSSYAAPLDAAGTRSAVGLSSANLDTQLGAAAGTRLVEGSYTHDDLVRLNSAVQLGKTTIVPGSPGATVTFRDVNDSVDRVVADMDGSERSSMTLTP